MLKKNYKLKNLYSFHPADDGFQYGTSGLIVEDMHLIYQEQFDDFHQLPVVAPPTRQHVPFLRSCYYDPRNNNIHHDFSERIYLIINLCLGHVWNFTLIWLFNK